MINWGFHEFRGDQPSPEAKEAQPIDSFFLPVANIASSNYYHIKNEPWLTDHYNCIEQEK